MDVSGVVEDQPQKTPVGNRYHSTSEDRDYRAAEQLATVTPQLEQLKMELTISRSRVAQAEPTGDLS